jgi:hypothetical protein
MKIFTKKISLLIVILATQLSCSKSGAQVQPVVIKTPAAVNYNNIINSESAFILAHQTSEGAFTMSANMDVQGYKIVPYFSNIAARALLESPTPAVITAVKNWMVWYMSHLNADGSVYDYYASNYTGTATYTSTGDFDSVDSYAATFMTLATRLCEVSPSDKAWLTNNYSAELKLIGNALSLVMESNGLTVAKPSYQIEYTMDNAEVNEGLADMVWLSQNVISGGDAAYWQTLLANNSNAIGANLWNGANNRYFAYNGGPVANWSTFYADATCQLYPIWCGVILPTSPRAKGLWQTFNTNYPNWPAGEIYDAGGFPWTVISYVSAVMGDKTKTDSYLRYVQSYTDKARQPTANWYNLEAAFVILAAKKQSRQ